jgi:hypothetical protein
MIDYTITYLKAQKLEKLYWTIVQKNVTSGLFLEKFCRNSIKQATALYVHFGLIVTVV